MAGYSIWTLIKRHRDGYLVTVSAIPLAGEERRANDYLTDYCATLEEAKHAGQALSHHLAETVARRGDEVISTDMSVEESTAGKVAG